MFSYLQTSWVSTKCKQAAGLSFIFSMQTANVRALWIFLIRQERKLASCSKCLASRFATEYLTQGEELDIRYLCFLSQSELLLPSSSSSCLALLISLLPITWPPSCFSIRPFPPWRTLGRSIHDYLDCVTLVIPGIFPFLLHLLIFH